MCEGEEKIVSINFWHALDDLDTELHTSQNDDLIINKNTHVMHGTNWHVIVDNNTMLLTYRSWL